MVGSPLGRDDGVRLGAEEGAKFGTAVGLLLGARLGTDEGTLLGVALGAELGPGVGPPVGTVLGILVGTIEGVVLGPMEGLRTLLGLEYKYSHVDDIYNKISTSSSTGVKNSKTKTPPDSLAFTVCFRLFAVQHGHCQRRQCGRKFRIPLH